MRHLFYPGSPQEELTEWQPRALLYLFGIRSRKLKYCIAVIRPRNNEAQTADDGAADPAVQSGVRVPRRRARLEAEPFLVLCGRRRRSLRRNVDGDVMSRRGPLVRPAVVASRARHPGRDRRFGDVDSACWAPCWERDGRRRGRYCRRRRRGGRPVSAGGRQDRRRSRRRRRP